MEAVEPLVALDWRIIWAIPPCTALIMFVGLWIAGCVTSGDTGTEPPEPRR